VGCGGVPKNWKPEKLKFGVPSQPVRIPDFQNFRFSLTLSSLNPAEWSMTLKRWTR
jgi:hypothetical protein